MRTTRLSQFFREARSAVVNSPEVRDAVRKATQDAVTKGLERFIDRFERPSRPAPNAPRPPSAADTEYVTGLYRELLGREPDAEGLRSHLAGLSGGLSREDLRQVFLTSAEYRERQARPPAPPPAEPTPTPAPPAPPPVVLREPGRPLATVPLKPEYRNARIDTSSASAAALSAARWAKDAYPELFTRAHERQVTFEIMTHVIGALRVAGYDATRVVNHPSFPVGHGNRYGTDAVVIEGMVFDVYGSFGEQNIPQALNHGPYAPGRLRE